MADIHKLLEKQNLTGQELGIIELTNMAVQFKQALKGEKPKALIEASQLQQMVNQLKDPTQAKIYGGYISIHEWLLIKYNIAQTQIQQAQLQYRTLESLITTAILAEDICKYVEQLPAIMTQKQYDQVKGNMEMRNINTRAFLNGIAVIQPSNTATRNKNIDQNGNYIEPKIQSSIKNFSLEAFFTESKDHANNIEIVETSRKTFLDSYYFVISYNHVLKRIAAIYGVKELEAFKMNIEELSARIDDFNALVPVLYEQIKTSKYGNKELRAKKLQVLKDFFRPVEYASLCVSNGRKRQLEDLLKDFKAFRPENADRFYSLLCTRTQSKGKGA